MTETLRTHRPLLNCTGITKRCYVGNDFTILYRINISIITIDNNKRYLKFKC